MDIEVRNIEVQNSRVSVGIQRCSTSELGKVVVPKTSVDNLSFGLDLARTRIERIGTEWAIAGGEVESPVLAETLRKLKYLPKAWSQPHPVSFCAGVVLTSSGQPTIPLHPCNSGSTSESELSLTAGVTISPDFQTFQFAALSHINSPLLKLRTEAAGNNASLALQKIESQAGSPLAISRGTGRLSFDQTPEAAFELKGVGFPAQKLLAGGARFKASFPSLCSPGTTRLSSTVSNLHWSGRNGLESQNRQLDFQLSQNSDSRRGQLDIRGRLEGLSFRGQRAGEVQPWLRMEIPAVKFMLRGQSDPGILPEHLLGEASFQLENTPSSVDTAKSNSILKLSPLRFHVGLRSGRFDVPSQSLQLQQSLLHGISSTVPFTAEGSAQLESLGPSPSSGRNLVCWFPN